MGEKPAAGPPAFDLLSTPPRVALANFYPFAPGEEAGRHWSESNLYLPVTHGLGRVQAGPRIFPLHAGQILQVPWAAPIAYFADRGDPFVVIGIHLVYAPWPAPPAGRPLHTVRQVDFTRASMQSAPTPQPFREPMLITPPPEARLFDLASEIAHAYEQGIQVRDAAEREALLRGLALAFIAEFLFCASGQNRCGRTPHASAAQARVVREIGSYMELALAQPLRRPALAARAGLSESGLAEAFRAVTGRAPIDYLIDLRLAHAKRLLRTGRARMGEVAARVGIPDVYYFSKLFKRRVGCPPREYRKRLRI